MGVTEAVRVQPKAMEHIAHALMSVGNTRGMNAEQRAAFGFDCGGQPFWQENERTIRALALIGDLIRLSQTQFVFRLLFFECTQIGEENVSA